MTDRQPIDARCRYAILSEMNQVLSKKFALDAANFIPNERRLACVERLALRASVELRLREDQAASSNLPLWMIARSFALRDTTVDGAYQFSRHLFNQRVRGVLRRLIAFLRDLRPASPDYGTYAITERDLEQIYYFG